MPDVITLQEKLGVSFSTTALIKQALVHSSFTNENPLSVQAIMKGSNF